MKKLVIVMGCLAAVSACTDATGLNAESDGLCAAQLGQPCTTIQQADRGGASLQPYKTFQETAQDTRNSQLSQKTLPVASAKGKTTTRTAAAGAPNGGPPYHVASYRIPERLGTLWLAPRLDDGGVFHEAGFVHFVVRGASWGQR